MVQQANRQWFTKLTEFLLQNGFTQSYADTSLFTYKKDNDFLTLVVYVDDILLIGNNLKLINHIKHQLDVAFSIKDFGSLNYYLGIEFLRNDKGITMTQRKYALELLHSADVLDLKPLHIPVDPIAKLNETDGDRLIDPSQYRTLVGKLLYLTIIRPDLSYAAHCLSQFSYSSRTPHLKALIKVLRYIKATCEIAWLLSLFKDLHISTSTPIPILCDNQSSISLVANPVQHARTKHIEIDCHFVREKIKAGILLPIYIPTHHQVGDALTKGLREHQLQTPLLQILDLAKLAFPEKEKKGLAQAMAKEDAFLIDDVEGGLCVDNTDAGIDGRCNSGSSKDKGKVGER
ncbi:cysteine-rich receptor-like protein kinase 8 [Tanacetum coccineum]